MRCALLGVSAGKLKADPDLGSKPAEKSLLTLWKHFTRLQEEESGHTYFLNTDSSSNISDDEDVEVKGLQSNSVLTPLQWSTLMDWIQGEAEFGIGGSYRRACACVVRGLPIWRKMYATAKQFEEISFGLLLNWAYPSAKQQDIAGMISCIGRHELEKLRQPSPRLIDSAESRQLERIFKTTYARGRSVITADDIAGGMFPDAHTREHTLVDAKLAAEVFGTGDIDLRQFMEHMCEGSARGHDSVGRVQLPGGSASVRVCRENLNFAGWILEEPPKSDRSQVELVNALELEVLKWRDGRGE